MKRVIIFLGILLIFILGMNFYIQKHYQTIECWWGVMYPSLSFIAIEDEETIAEEPIKFSSLNNDYIYITKQQYAPIKYKFAIIEWLKQKFSF